MERVPDIRFNEEALALLGTGPNGQQRRQRRGAISKHSRRLDPRLYLGAEQASYTKARPWDLKDSRRKKNKAARAARRKNR